MSGDQNKSVGRDELAFMLGASHASDLIVAVDTKDTTGGLGALSGGAGVNTRKQQGGKDDDISKMDRAQAAALVARQFGAGSSAGAAGQGNVARHRATGKRKRMMQHHLLAGDLLEENKGMSAVEEEKEEDVVELYQNGEEKEDDGFAAVGRRKKSEAKVLVRKRGEGGDRRRRGHSSSDSDSVSSKSSSDSSSCNRRRNRGGRNRRRSGSASSSSSSSASEDEADVRRRRARERAKTNHSEAREESGEGDEMASEPLKRTESEDMNSGDDAGSEDVKVRRTQQRDSEKAVTKQSKAKPVEKEAAANKSRQNRHGRPSKSESSSSSGSSSSSDSSDDSSASSSGDEPDHSLPATVSKPLFVPKSKRGTVAEVEAQQQKMEEAEERKAKEAERRAFQSRALVAEAVSASGKNASASSGLGNEDEFDVGEAGSEFIPIPDDSDPNEQDSPELVLAERDAWEVRELIRILRDVDEAAEAEKEKKELARRRAMTDEERLDEDRRIGRYRAPGEARRRPKDDKSRENNYLQRYHHRGAFYMDEDTLGQAGEDDVRHRAAEYSRAATGEDKVDKSALPKVMQVKKFGFAGYGTKVSWLVNSSLWMNCFNTSYSRWFLQYKGLAKEDTTDKQLDFLPIGGKGKRNGGGGGGDRGYNGGR